MPRPLFTKLIATLAIGFACLLFGCIYFVTTRDTIFLLLSITLFSCSFIKALVLYLIVKKKNYISFRGTCLEVKRHRLRQTSVITFELDDGSTYELVLDRMMKLRKNIRYELYFETSRITDPRQSSPMNFLCLKELL